MSTPGRPTCHTCPFFEPKISCGDLGDYGECRRFPPTLTNLRNGKLQGAEGPRSWFISRYPEVYIHIWCGEHPDSPAYLAGLKSQEAPK